MAVIFRTIRLGGFIMSTNLDKFMDQQDGVASVSELAAVLEVDEQVVRRWARDHNIRRLGSTFVFSVDAARELEADLFGDEEDDEDDGEEDADDEDEGDGEDDEDDEGDSGDE
jgi:hypothetical protein